MDLDEKLGAKVNTRSDILGVRMECTVFMTNVNVMRIWKKDESTESNYRWLFLASNFPCCFPCWWHWNCLNPNWSQFISGCFSFEPLNAPSLTKQCPAGPA